MTEAQNIPKTDLPEDRPPPSAKPGQQQEQTVPGNDPAQQEDTRGKEQLQK